MSFDQRKFVKMLFPLLFYCAFKKYEIVALGLIRSEYFSDLALRRRRKHRLKWSEVNERISDLQFRKMFCMSRHCFDLLCNSIIEAIGESKFKSETYIDTILPM